jgi:hypothetical protein
MGIEDIAIKQDREVEPDLQEQMSNSQRRRKAALLEMLEMHETKVVRQFRHLRPTRAEIAQLHCVEPQKTANIQFAVMNSVLPLLREIACDTIKVENTGYSVKIMFLTPKNKKVFHVAELFYSEDFVHIENFTEKGAGKFCESFFDRFSSKDARKLGLKRYEITGCLWRGWLAAQNEQNRKVWK